MKQRCLIDAPGLSTVPGLELGSSHGFGKQVTLKAIDAHFSELSGRIVVFDAFGHRLHTQRMGQADDGLDHAVS